MTIKTKLKAGLIGCGSLSQRAVLPHLSLSDCKEKIQIEAVVDINMERSRQTAEKFNIPSHFSNLEQMLSSADIDLVLVITPIPYHYSNALAALKAGKHVYIQKAMTTKVEEANELLSFRDKMGLKLSAAPGFDLFPSTGQIREIVKSGELGRVNVAYSYTFGFGHEFEMIRNGNGEQSKIDPTWYYQNNIGPLPDVTVYALQLLTSVLGPVHQVTALANKTATNRLWQGESIKVEVNDNSIVLMEFLSGSLAVAVGSNCNGSQRIPWGGLGLYGTEGILEITEVHHESGYPTVFEVVNKKHTTVKYKLTDQKYLESEHSSIEEQHVYVDIMDLVDSIIEDRAPIATGEQAAHVVEIIEKTMASIETGKKQIIKSRFKQNL